MSARINQVDVILSEEIMNKTFVGVHKCDINLANGDKLIVQSSFDVVGDELILMKAGAQTYFDILKRSQMFDVIMKEYELISGSAHKHYFPSGLRKLLDSYIGKSHER